MDVKIDEAGSDDEPRGVKELRAVGLEVLSRPGDAPVADEQIATRREFLRRESLRWIDDRPVPDEQASSHRPYDSPLICSSYSPPASR